MAAANSRFPREHRYNVPPPPVPYWQASTPVTGNVALPNIQQIAPTMTPTPTMPANMQQHVGMSPVGMDDRRGYTLPPSHPSQITQTQGPHVKLPTFDGKDEIEVFLTPFERLARRYGWTPCEKVDILYESLQGKAMWYVCSLPQQLTEDYDALKSCLVKRFGRKDPAGTMRRRLSEMRQRAE